MRALRTPRPRHELARDNPVASAVARAAMRQHLVDFAIHIYMHDDCAEGPDTRELLAHLGWMVGLGAEVAASQHPGTPQARRLHGALRTVVQMSADGGIWRARHAPALQAAADESKTLLITFATSAMRLMPGADDLASRITSGEATMADVAGAEIYNPPPAEAAQTITL